MHFQNIDFDIDIEIFENFDIDIGIDIEKNGQNIGNLSCEKEKHSRLFGLIFYSSPLSFEIAS